MEDVSLWHLRLSHLIIDNLIKLLTKYQFVDGLLINKDKKFKFCKECVFRMQHKESFPNEGGLRFGEVLGLIHCNVWGLTKTTSFGGVQYFKTFVNNWSRKRFCYFLQRKGKCFSKFLEGESIIK